MSLIPGCGAGIHQLGHLLVITSEAPACIDTLLVSAARVFGQGFTLRENCIHLVNLILIFSRPPVKISSQLLTAFRGCLLCEQLM